MAVDVYIGLGSNLQQPRQQLQNARDALNKLAIPGTLKISPIYRTQPMGPAGQPDYLNAVAMFQTGLTPLDLLSQLHAIEASQGRERDTRWDSRTLDLDILLYGIEQINLPELIIPHAGISERAFVLYPLYDLNHDLVIPGQGKISELLQGKLVGELIEKLDDCL